jgi:DNA repair protein RecN (Recombination protein N)
MLIELSVRNLAVFEDVCVAFVPGLNVVTGETGAGKSVLVEAIRLAVGEKGDPQAIRAGEAEAEVNARFDLAGRPELRDAFEEAGLPWEEELVLRRVVPSTGRSRAWLNGRPAAQAAVSAISPLLIEMVSQHSVPLLLSRPAALAAIDAFAGTIEQAADARRAYRRVAALRRDVEEAAIRSATCRDRIEGLDFRIAELSRAKPMPGESDEIAAELSLLKGGEKVLAAVDAAEEALSASEHGALAVLSFAASRLREAASADPRIAGFVDRVASLKAEVGELARELVAHGRGIDISPARRERLEERLSELRRLERKYATDASGLVRQLGELRAEREGLDGALDEERRLRAALSASEADALRIATALSASRHAAAGPMARAAEAELEKVDLPGAKLQAEVVSRDASAASLSASGIDDAELLFCANPGQELRPLAQVASGGELSRVMLALRNGAASGAGRRTVVFDEIDTGIGGKVAERVGARLKALASGTQVVCVTHLPQVAAFADAHLLVSKEIDAGAVKTRVKPLGKQDRINELARMVSGAEVTAEAKAHARELIGKAGGA